MKPEAYSERQVQVEGWPVNLSSYRVAGEFHCNADNVSPGACLARATGASRDEAEDKALDKARELLSKTRRYKI